MKLNFNQRKVLIISVLSCFFFILTAALAFASLALDGTSIVGNGSVTLQGGSNNLLIDTANSNLIYTATEPTPVAPTVALAGSGAGNVDNGAHVYVITCINSAPNPGMETTPSPISSVVTVANNATNGKVTVTLPMCLQSSSNTGDGSGRNIYRSKAGITDPTNDQLFLLAASPVTTPWVGGSIYTDNIADSTLLAIHPPTINTDTSIVAQWAPGRKTTNGSLFNPYSFINWDLPHLGTDSMNGIISVIRQSFAVNTGYLAGAQFVAYNGYNPGDPIANVTGGYGGANIIGLVGEARNRAATTVNGIAGVIGVAYQTSTGKTNNAWGFYAPHMSGNIDHIAGLYIDVQGPGNIDAHGIYQKGPEPNHFGGPILTTGLGVGTAVPKNMEGSCTFVTATTCAVTFSANETDANYDVFVDTPANIGAIWVTPRANTGFTINAGTSNSETVRWFLVKR